MPFTLRHHVVPLLAAAFLTAGPRIGAASQELSRGLIDEGDRFYSRGQYRTAVKLYQTAEKSLAPGSMPAAALFRWGESLFGLGEYREAEGRFRTLRAGPAAGCDPLLVRLYLGCSLAWLGDLGEARAALEGTLMLPEGEDPLTSTARLLALELADAGERRAAVILLDRVYRRAASESARRDLAELARVVIMRPPGDVDILVSRDRGLPGPDTGIAIPVLELLLAAGRIDEVEDAARTVGKSASDTASSAVLADLGRKIAAAREKQAVKIGVLLPLTGNYQFFGRKILQAFQLAKELYPGSGASLLVRDTGGDPETARREAQALIEGEGVKAILGPALSAVAEKVIPVATAKKVPLLSPAAQGPGLMTSDQVFFRNCITLQQQARFVANAALRGAAVSRFAVFSPGDNYGKALTRAFWDEVTAQSGKVLYSVTYGLEQTDFNKEIKLLRGEEEVRPDDKEGEEAEFIPPFEAVYIPDTFNRVGLIAPQLSFHDIEPLEVILLGSSGLDTPEYVRIGEEYVEGSIFLDGFFPGRETEPVRSFITRYQARYGEKPDVMAAQAYDAAAILFFLIREGRRERDAIRSGLSSLKDFPGVCNPTSIASNGESDREPVFITVFRGRLTELVLPH